MQDPANTPLLSTKFHILTPRQDSVRRPRLINRLHAGLDNKFTIISAPPGFGKTALVSEWVSDLKGKGGHRVAWLSLDENDSHSAGFFTYLIGSLQSIDTESASYMALGRAALGQLQLPQPPPTEEILSGLLNQISALRDSIVLVLDDYHAIEDDSVSDGLSFFIEHLPVNMHLAITTRADPMIPLGRLRARNEMTELRAADLRFTLAETDHFLNRTMGLDLSGDHIAALEERTEGWAAGLQLAAVSLDGSTDPGTFIASFTGSHRHIVDFPAQEVLDRQPPETRRFLLQTSILGRMCGSLCDAVTGGDDGEELLEILERSNMFVIPLDEQRRWFRYHHLFMDLLRQQLLKSQSDHIADHHKNAGTWFAENGFVEEAIEHALYGEDFEFAADLIEDQAEGKWVRGNINCWRLTDRLPDELVMARPFLCLLRAYYLCTSGAEAVKIQNYLDVAERAVNSGSRRAAVLRGRLAAIRALIDSYWGILDGIVKNAGEAHRLLPEPDALWRSLVSLTAGDVHGYLEDMAAAFAARSEALMECRATGSVYHTMGAALKVAITVREQGHLRQTVDICRRQLALAEREGLSVLKGWSSAVLGETLAEMDQLSEGQELTARGYQLAKQSYNKAVVGWVFVCHLRVLFSGGKLGEAQNVIDNTMSLADQSVLPPWVISQISDWQARLYLRQEKMNAALQLLTDRKLITDEGPELARLLVDAAGRGGSEGYAHQVLRSISSVKGESAPGPVYVEPLSRRELEVLSLNGEGLSNQLIGEKLFISLHTVKAHTRNIYAKIDAHSRTDAVAKGRAFGLLPTGTKHGGIAG